MTGFRQKHGILSLIIDVSPWGDRRRRDKFTIWFPFCIFGKIYLFLKIENIGIIGYKSFYSRRCILSFLGNVPTVSDILMFFGISMLQCVITWYSKDDLPVLVL